MDHGYLLQTGQYGSTISIIILAGKRLFRSSRVTSFDPVRNALIEHPEVRAKSDAIYPALLDFVVTAADDTVTALRRLSAYLYSIGPLLYSTLFDSPAKLQTRFEL